MGGNASTPSSSNYVLIIGSIGIDQTIFSEDIPKYGEINKGKIVKNPGGKGNNEAIACARAGGETIFIGVVGDDSDQYLKQKLEEDNVSPVLKVKKNVETHCAHIIIGPNGQSKIVVNPGADYYLDINYINENQRYIDNASIVMFQLEIPIETVEYGINISYEKNKIIILRPSPAVALNDNIIKKVTYLIPNESELGVISGMPTKDERQIDEACKNIMDRGAKNLIVPLGSKGCILWNKDGKKEYSSYITDNAIDYTGYVDCFIGVFAAFLSKNYKLDEAIKYANLAASISVTIVGTISSYPKLEDIKNKKDKITNW